MDNNTSAKKIAALKKILLSFTQVVLAFLAVGVAAYKISDYTGSLDGDLFVQGVPWFLAAGASYLVFYVVLASHWQYITRHIEPKVSNYQWLAFFAAQPYKYLPTSIFTLTFRAKYARKLGMSIKKSSLAQFIENISMLASATAIAAPVWLALNGQRLLGLLVFFVCLLGFVFGFEVLARTKFSVHFPLKARLSIFALSALGWTVAGLAFYLVLLGLNESIYIIEAISANAAAFEAGIIAVFAPGGIGIRELVFSLFGIGAMSIIAWRLVTAIVDLLVGPVAWLYIRRLTAEKTK